MNQNMSLENELENLLRAVEEIIQIIMRVNEKKSAIANSDNQSEKKRLEKEIESDLSELNDKQDDLNMVKNTLGNPGILKENEIEGKQTVNMAENNPSPVIAAIPISSEKEVDEIKLTSTQEKEKDAIAKEMEVLAQDAESIINEVNEDSVKYPSLLNSIGNQILTIDQRLESLKNRMEVFFENIPQNVKIGVALFFVNRLENVSSKIEALKEKFAESVQFDQDEEVAAESLIQKNENTDAQKSIEMEPDIPLQFNETKNNIEIIETIEQVPEPVGISLPSSEDFVLKEESKMSTPSFQTARQMISTQGGKEFFTIKALIGGIQSSANALQHEIALKEQSFIQDEKVKSDTFATSREEQNQSESINIKRSNGGFAENHWDLAR